MSDLVIVPPDDWEAMQKVINKATAGAGYRIPRTAYAPCGTYVLRLLRTEDNVVLGKDSKEKRGRRNHQNLCAQIPVQRLYVPERIPCDGHSTYSAKKVEEAVISALKGYLCVEYPRADGNVYLRA